jgi:hypothetical protein
MDDCGPRVSYCGNSMLGIHPDADDMIGSEEMSKESKKFKKEKKAVKKAAKKAGEKAAKNAKVDRSDPSTKYLPFST